MVDRREWFENIDGTKSSTITRFEWIWVPDFVEGTGRKEMAEVSNAVSGGRFSVI